MNERFEQYAVAVIIVFGALVIGGLMSAGLTFHSRDVFLFALGAAAAAWLAGNALLYDRLRLYVFFIGLTIVLGIASTVVLIF